MSKSTSAMHSENSLTYYSSILDAAIAVTNAIAQLIKSATVSQHEVNLQLVPRDRYL